MYMMISVLITTRQLIDIISNNIHTNTNSDPALEKEKNTSIRANCPRISIGCIQVGRRRKNSSFPVTKVVETLQELMDA